MTKKIPPQRPEDLAKEEKGHPQHPIRTKLYVLPTPSTEGAYNEVLRVIKAKNASGLILIGDYRGGKTRFCMWTLGALQGEFQEAPLVAYHLTCERHTKRSPTEKRHLNWLIAGVKYAISARDPYDRKKQLHDYLIQEGKRSARKQVVLLIDEAQELWFDQWQWLLDTFNALDVAGVTPTFVFIGQSELSDMRKSFQKVKLGPVVQRFMVGRRTLRGPASDEETAEWAKSFDELSAGIADDGLPFTEHFFPAAYRAGWRLQFIGKDLYRCFRLACDEAGLPFPGVIRTKYFFNAIESLFTWFGNDQVITPDMSDDVLLAAIADSQYIESLREQLVDEDDRDDEEEGK